MTSEPHLSKGLVEGALALSGARNPTRYSWTQPCCGSCFLDLNPGRQPTRLKHAECEQCCRCGKRTDDGIYIRTDPATTPFPSRTKGD